MADPHTTADADNIERRTGIAIRAYFVTEQVSEAAWENMRKAVRALARDDSFPRKVQND